MVVLPPEIQTAPLEISNPTIELNISETSPGKLAKFVGWRQERGHNAIESKHAFFIELGKRVLSEAGIFDPNALSSAEREEAVNRAGEVEDFMYQTSGVDAKLTPLSGEQPKWPEIKPNIHSSNLISPFQRLKQWRIERNARKLKAIQPQRVEFFGKHPLDVKTMDDVGASTRSYWRYRKHPLKYHAHAGKIDRIIWETPLERKTRNRAETYQGRIEKLTISGKAARKRTEHIARHTPSPGTNTTEEMMELLTGGLQIQSPSIQESAVHTLAEATKMTLLRDPIVEPSIDHLPDKYKEMLDREYFTKAISLAGNIYPSKILNALSRENRRRLYLTTAYRLRLLEHAEERDKLSKDRINSSSIPKGSSAANNIVLSNLLSTESLHRLDFEISEQIRSRVHEERDKRGGVSSLPREEFKAIRDETREEILRKYFGDNEVPEHTQQLIRQYLRELRRK